MFFKQYLTTAGEMVNIDMHQVTVIRKADSSSCAVHLRDGKSWLVALPFDDLIADLVDVTATLA